MIKTFLVDDELPAIQELQYFLEDYPEVAVAGIFTNAKEALIKIQEEKPDVVFLDIDMPFINGIELAMKIQAMRSGTIIVFVTAYSEYSLEAFKVYPLDYILKPIDEEHFSQTMEQLLERYRLIQKEKNSAPDVSIRCFGRLEIYKIDYQAKGQGNREKLIISSEKVRELFAYLISYFWKPASEKELTGLLFNGEENSKNINELYGVMQELRKTLESFGVQRQLVKIKQDYTLEIAPGVCDYVDLVNFVNNNPVLDEENYREAERLVKLYRGAFLGEEDYSWLAEIEEWVEEMMEGLKIKLANFYETAEK